MGKYQEYLEQYVVLLFTDKDESISINPARLLREVLPKRMEIERFIAIDDGLSFKSGEIAKNIVIIVHQEHPISPSLANYLNTIRQQGKKVLVAIHYRIPTDNTGFGEGNIADLIREYNHELRSDLVWDSFSLACLACDVHDKPKFEESYVGLVEAILSSNIERLSLLKHRIARLFISMDVDFQGMAEIRQESIKSAVDYLKDILSRQSERFVIVSQEPRPYTSKLHELKFLIETSRSVLNVRIQQLGMDWTVLKTLTELGETGKPINDFMSKLDILSGISEQISEPNVTEILDFFKNYNGGGWRVDGATPQTIGSFHDWFCALNNVLDDLMEK